MQQTCAAKTIHISCLGAEAAGPGRAGKVERGRQGEMVLIRRTLGDLFE
jgi:hypothetical protein